MDNNSKCLHTSKQGDGTAKLVALVDHDHLCGVYPFGRMEPPSACKETKHFPDLPHTRVGFYKKGHKDNTQIPGGKVEGIEIAIKMENATVIQSKRMGHYVKKE